MKNQVQKGNYVPYQRQTRRSPITLLLLITTLAGIQLFAGCGSGKTDDTSTESSYVETAETLETSTIETSEEETEEETKKEKSESTHETDVDETEESGTSKKNQDEKDKEGTKKETSKETAKESTKESASTKPASTSGSNGNGNTGNTGNATTTTQASTKAPETTKAQETTKAAVTLTSIQAAYTGGTKTEGAAVSGAEISVTAVYSDGSRKAVNGWSCPQANQSLPAGSHTFTVTYEGKNSSFTVNVNAAPVQTQAPTEAPTQAEQPATSQAYIDEFMRGFNQARIDAGLPGNIGVNAKWSVYAQYYAEYMAKTFGSTGQEMTSDWHSDCIGWSPDNEGIGYAYSPYNAGYAQTEHVGAHQYEDFGDIGVGVYYYQGRYYVCVQTWEWADAGYDVYPQLP